MAASEMGIRDSEQYLETYERFMADYDLGKPIADIVSDILEDSIEEFGEDSGILHGVYFALAKCRWLCGGVDASLMEIVAEIIESGRDLSFYRELGADEAELKLRKRNLTAFLKRLRQPPAKVRPRKRAESEYCAPIAKEHPQLPCIASGDLVAYPVQERWRVFLVMEIYGKKNTGKKAYCFLWDKLFAELPAADGLLQERGMPLGNVAGDAFPTDLQVIGRLDMPTNYHALFGREYPMWEKYIAEPTRRDRFYKALPRNFCVPLEAALRRIKALLEGIR